MSVPGPPAPACWVAPCSWGVAGAPYRHCRGPGDGLRAGLGARLLRVRLCWCVQGQAVLRGDRGLARVVLRRVWGRWGVLGRDAVLWWRGVLGGGVGLGHRFGGSRGVLIALRRERKQGRLDTWGAPHPTPSHGQGTAPSRWAGGSRSPRPLSAGFSAAFSRPPCSHGGLSQLRAGGGACWSGGAPGSPGFEATHAHFSDPSTLKAHFLNPPNTRKLNVLLCNNWTPLQLSEVTRSDHGHPLPGVPPQ